MTNIGLIGLGRIGMPIAKHLIDGGHRVLGFRRSSMADFEAIGGHPLASAEAVGAAADTIFTCVSGDAAMDEVVEGLSKTARPGQVVVCFSSHTVPVKQQYADQLAQHGAILLDGEVSGTPGMVVARKASVYLAGPEDAAQRAEQAVRGFADQYFYLGAFGSATKVKLINNFLVALDIAGTAQAMAIGLKMGIDPTLMIKAVGMGSGASTQFNIRAPWMAERKFSPPQGLPAVLLGYLNGVKAAGADAGASTELVDDLIDIYQRAIPVVGDRDVAAILELFETNRLN
jgi:3-hydroxyisobutyrate dehydrogenase-like beta-hydroxyacid dehydrogenase